MFNSFVRVVRTEPPRLRADLNKPQKNSPILKPQSTGDDAGSRQRKECDKTRRRFGPHDRQQLQDRLGLDSIEVSVIVPLGEAL